MTAITEDTALTRSALADVNELRRELIQENEAASLGTQIQVVNFILADPELRPGRRMEPHGGDRGGDNRAAATAAD